MTAEADAADSKVAIARIEATLTAIKNQIDYSERASAQLVKMVDERVTSRFDGVGARFDVLERRLNEMDSSRERARHDDLDWRSKVESRIGALENFNSRILGIAFGVAIGTGATMTAALKAFHVI